MCVTARWMCGIQSVQSAGWKLVMKCRSVSAKSPVRIQSVATFYLLAKNVNSKL